MIERTHVSAVRLTELRATTQLPASSIKPLGFWYEINGDWRRWCASEEPGWIEGLSLYNVTVGSDARLLTLRSVKDIDRFHAAYSVKKPAWPIRSLISWYEVAQKYDGVEITPYMWERRLDGAASDWYYSWDCASGCLWRPHSSSVALTRERLEVIG